jgi:predicted cupin superfamily sugar epimerase
MLDPDEIIERLGLEPHPEGGWFKETFRDEASPSGRAHGTAIYYLLKAGESSHWHRVDAAEIWHWYAGGPLSLQISANGQSPEPHRLGPNLADGERPQLIVPTGHWQAAEPLGVFTLVGCTVAPGFDFAGFEMAPKGWKPGK